MKSQNKLQATISQTELCVLCGQKTAISVATPIEQRVGYIEGVGQLCYSCQQLLNKTHGIKSSKNNSL